MKFDALMKAYPKCALMPKPNCPSFKLSYCEALLI